MAPSRTVAPPHATTPSSPVTTLPQVGADRARRLEKLGIVTVADLLHHLPSRYEDSRSVVELAALVPGQEQTAEVTIATLSKRPSNRNPRMLLVEAVLTDDSGRAGAIWFNQPHLLKMLHVDMRVIVHGTVEVSRARDRPVLGFRNPKWEPVRDGQRHVGLLAPVYRETAGITSKWLRERIEPALRYADAVPDRLPASVRVAEALMPTAEALRQVHFPEDERARERARERFAFEEHFLLQLAVERARRQRLSSDGVVIPYDVPVARRFAASLPFTLTTGQRASAHQILQDMAGPGPMSRLLQGDVGSGKTVVASMAAVMTAAAGRQTAIMAPTEILARQHHATLTALLEPHGMTPRMLLGSTPPRARREILEAMANGRESLVVGTHALLEDDVVFADLGLVVIDEQHRFGVAQRQSLRRKGSPTPNFLAMTATPIPRSLALTLYGDVNVSELRELPPGRTPVATTVVAPHQRADAYAFVREHVAAGRQAYVICPLIDESDKLGARAATAEYERLSGEVFPDLRVELLHGRLPSRDKEERMARFASGNADILVATSVIEVGVDVANASIMVIEGAERFGLAQLHQFRGRIGRGAHRSFCLLFQSSVDAEGSKRLETVARTSSGFELAEVDLRLRGAGDVAGLRQHGLPEMLAADLLDAAMAQRAKQAALAWLDRDPELTLYPPLEQAMNGYRAVMMLD